MKKRFPTTLFQRSITSGIILIFFCIALLMKTFGQTSEWKIFNTSNSEIPDNTVFITGFQDNGTKWIGTNDGLSKLDGTNWTTFNMSNSGLPSNIVYGLMIEQPGTIWIGTNGSLPPYYGGLAIYNDTTWTVYNPSNSILLSNWITEIVMDNKGNKWIGTENGVYKYDGTNFTIIPPENHYYASVSSLAINYDTVLWIGTSGGGVSKFDGTNWDYYAPNNSGCPAYNVWALVNDTLENIWIGTNGGGLAKFDGTNWTVYNTSNSGLPVNDVKSVAIDKDYTIWIGTWEGGLVSLHDSSWTVYNKSNSQIPSDVVYSVKIDELGNKWLGTPSGLAIFNKGGILGIENHIPGSSNKLPVSLEQIYPNPFVSITTLCFSLNRPGNVTLRIFNILGTEVAVPVNKKMTIGNYSIQYNGNCLSPGIYTCVLSMNGYNVSRKILKGLR